MLAVKKLLFFLASDLDFSRVCNNDIVSTVDCAKYVSNDL